ncbi:interferon-induced very large GTPase 1-like [Gastrophryne carolinensis]
MEEERFERKEVHLKKGKEMMSRELEFSNKDWKAIFKEEESFRNEVSLEPDSNKIEEMINQRLKHVRINIQEWKNNHKKIINVKEEGIGHGSKHITEEEKLTDQELRHSKDEEEITTEQESFEHNKQIINKVSDHLKGDKEDVIHQESNHSKGDEEDVLNQESEHIKGDEKGVINQKLEHIKGDEEDVINQKFQRIKGKEEDVISQELECIKGDTINQQSEHSKGGEGVIINQESEHMKGDGENKINQESEQTKWGEKDIINPEPEHRKGDEENKINQGSEQTKGDEENVINQQSECIKEDELDVINQESGHRKGDEEDIINQESEHAKGDEKHVINQESENRKGDEEDIINQESDHRKGDEEDIINQESEHAKGDEKHVINQESENRKGDEEDIINQESDHSMGDEEDIINQESDHRKGDEEDIINQESDHSMGDEEDVINQESEHAKGDEKHVINQESENRKGDEKHVINQESENRKGDEEDLIHQESKHIKGGEKDKINQESECIKGDTINQQLEHSKGGERDIINQESEHTKEDEENTIHQESEPTRGDEENVINQGLERIHEDELDVIHQESKHSKRDEEDVIKQESEQTKGDEEEVINQESEHIQGDEEHIINQESEHMKGDEVDVINQESESMKGEEGNMDEVLEHNKEKSIITEEEESARHKEEISQELKATTEETNINLEEQIISQELRNIEPGEIINEGIKHINKEREVINKGLEDNTYKKIITEHKKRHKEDTAHQESENSMKDEGTMAQVLEHNKENSIMTAEEGSVRHKKKHEKFTNQESEHRMEDAGNVDQVSEHKSQVSKNFTGEKNINLEEKIASQELKKLHHEELITIEEEYVNKGPKYLNKEVEFMNQELEHNNKEDEIINREDFRHEKEIIHRKSKSMKEEEGIMDQESGPNKEKGGITEKEGDTQHTNEMLIEELGQMNTGEGVISQELKNINQEKNINIEEEILNVEFEGMTKKGKNINQELDLDNKEEEIIKKEEENFKHEEEIIDQESEHLKEEEGNMDKTLEHKNKKDTVNVEIERIKEISNHDILEHTNRDQETTYLEPQQIIKEQFVNGDEEIANPELKPISKDVEIICKEGEVYQDLKNINKENENNEERIANQISEEELDKSSHTNNEQIMKKRGAIIHKELDPKHFVEGIVNEQSKDNREKESINQKSKYIFEHEQITIQESVVNNAEKIIQSGLENITNEEDMSGQRFQLNNKEETIITKQSTKIIREEGVIRKESEHINVEEGLTNKEPKHMNNQEVITNKEDQRLNKESEQISQRLKADNNEDKNLNEEGKVTKDKHNQENINRKKIFKEEDGKATRMEETTGNWMEINNYKEKIKWQSKRNKINEKLVELNLTKFQTTKLSRMELLKIGYEDLKKVAPQRIEDVPLHFLRTLVALNSTARNTRLNQSSETNVGSAQDEDMDFIDEIDPSNSIHPLDVLCLLLHCSDSSVQQELVTKMSMCQFALPLLLPVGHGSECTFMLWAMRDIVKRWRPQLLAGSKGCREENLVNIPVPVFSFVRLGKCPLSKSRLLNDILSSAQQHQDFFVHQNMEGANILPDVSDGLVEISWFFPGGREILDLFPDPIAITNLRGDLASNWNQFNFLTKVSTAVFIFIESMDDAKYNVLSNIEESNTNYFIILAPSSRYIGMETHHHIKKLYLKLKINRKNILVKNSSVNDAELVKKLQVMITCLIMSSPHYITVEEMSRIAEDLGIHVDENSEEHQKARQLATDITKSIKDVVRYKNDSMKLQGAYWKELAKAEKEMCRMKGLANQNAEDYRANLVEKCTDLRRQQSRCGMPDAIDRFIAALKGLQRVEKHFFLKWMKLYLDSVVRNHLFACQVEYKKHLMIPNVEKLKQLDQVISNSHLGVEHFIREVGQFYEAECFLSDQRKLRKLPGIAAELLLDGFPLELIDGDASNIPLQWVSDVLTELDKNTGGRCRVRVITVLGVQSTGKSTLLNTMFGLQFPVASGRCTRGAFMTLIQLKDKVIEELECEFILIIDTEGLKAPELATLENTYEHDNELATFVVGLSDITIINMAMENTAEMKDILQIVVHAFLRQKQIGKKPNCQFVHQNVSDVSAHEKNMRDRKKFLEQLDEMTQVASRMEGNSNIIKFSDVMDYDLEENSWYIPGLWHGVPPMASVNTGYSENVFKLKIHLFETMKKQVKSRKSQSISEFFQWVKSLWDAVKYEKFIFSFRNSLVAEAYNQLSIKYSELEWNFRKRMHKWLTEAENEIFNQPASELETETWTGIKGDMYKVLREQERIMLDALENYFEHKNRHGHLLERYREDFFRSISTLKNQIEDNLTAKCKDAICLQKGKREIQSVQNTYLKIIEEKATGLLDDCKSKKYQLSDEELEFEFKAMWNKTISGLQFGVLKKHNITQEMIDQLRKDMRHKAGYLNEKLNNVKSLEDCGRNGFNPDKNYVQGSWYESMPENYHYDYWSKVESLVSSLEECCSQILKEQVDTMKDYDQTYCQELLNVINEKLNQEGARSLHLTPLFELDLKLLLLAQAAPIFQEKHDLFFQENNMRFYLEKLKPQYFSAFKNVYHERDESKVRAQKFCETCLKPALLDYVYKNLGGEIVGDILTSGDSIRYSSRTFFQYTLLKDLLEDHDVTRYVKYNNHYETFVKAWIVKYITDRYKSSASMEPLKSEILASISRKVRRTLKDPRVRESLDVPQCLKTFCALLKKDLVVAQNDMKVVAFQNNASPVQFTADVEEFLDDVEKQVAMETSDFTIERALAKATVKPQDELFRKVFGCGKQCPFCKAPCEAGAADHKEHFASAHRPQGLGTYRDAESKVLSHSICSTDVVGDATFLNSDTEWKPRLFREYRKVYPDWSIQPDATLGASNYWKYVLKEFNSEFSDYSNAKPADLPQEWYELTKEQALQSLKETFNMS